jgi:hypothetical protein
MSFQLGVWARDRATESRWVTELDSAAQGMIEVRVGGALDGAVDAAQVVLIDAGLKNLEEQIAVIDRRGKALFLIVEESAGARVPGAFAHGLVDDVLVYPFRPLEVLSKLLRYHQILMWDEVGKLNASFSELLGRLQDDLRIAERLQKRSLPERFPAVKGFHVASRYLAGMKAGGDHFDLAESRDGQTLSLVLSDASTYGLSSALLSVLMSVAVKLSVEQMRSSLEVVSRIRDELLLTLTERDRLSLFYGAISRKDYKLKYLNLGSSRAFYASQGGEFMELPHQGDSISQQNSKLPSAEGEIVLQPGSRLVLLSDGFLEIAGGAQGACTLLGHFRGRESLDGLNEFVFKVKEKFEEPDDMPAQDCTAIVMDMEANVLRLAQK